MNRAFWRNWIVLWALMPVFSAFNGMATYRFFYDTVAVQPHHQAGIVGVFLLSSVLFLIAPFAVMGRFIRGYDFGAHILVLLSALVGTILQGWIFRPAPFSGVLGSFAHDFSSAVISVKLNWPIGLGDIAALPWEKLLITEIVSGLCVFAIPVAIICFVSRRLSELPRVLLSVLLAVFAVAVSEAIFDLIRGGLRDLDVLNEWPWPDRLAIIGSWSVSSMIGASISAVGIGLLVGDPVDRAGIRKFRRRLLTDGVHKALVLALVLWVISLGVNYASGPNGVRTNFAELRRVVDRALDIDVSSGESIVAFSHLLHADTFEFRNPHFVDLHLSADGRTAVLSEAHGARGRQLAAFDVSSGARIATLGPALSRNQRTSLFWTEDGDFLVVRSDGEPVEVGRYTQYEARLTLFSIPEYEEIAVWEPEGISCRNAPREEGVAQIDDGSLAVLCFSADASIDDHPLSVRLAVPSLETSSITPAVETGPHLQPERLIEVDGSIYAAFVRRGDEAHVLLADVGGSGRTIDLVDLAAPDRGGGLTFQGFVVEDDGSNAVGVRFCGAAADVSNPPRATTDAPWGPALCRIVRYELDGGSYIGHTDGPETRFGLSIDQPITYTLSVGPWVTSGEINPISSAGMLEIRDAGSGAIAQTIQSSAQRPLATSEPLGLLFTYRVFENRVAVYTIRR
ncbi:MAG: hypothetical protein AAF965_06675 [Pseudomonadota bacterium]